MYRLVYISRNYKSLAYGGAKARVDMEDILRDMGAVNLGLKRTFHSNKIYDFFRNLTGLVRFMYSIKPGDVILIQYPVKKYYRFICRWSHLRGARVVSLIHDLGSFRRRKLTVKEENSKLKMSDAIIPANDSMIAWLKEHGCDMPMTPQVAWDYLTDTDKERSVSNDLSLTFVGHLNMDRNEFLYKLPADLHVHLYGIGAPEKLPEHIVSHGFITSEEFLSRGEGKFGLVWYGPSLEHDDTGYIGEYIAYCNPHKLAFYIRAGMPVVLWRGAGAAPFVEQEGIGITVDSLKDLRQRLESVSDEEYERMLRNVARVGVRMAHGDYFRDALKRAIEMIEA